MSGLYTLIWLMFLVAALLMLITAVATVAIDKGYHRAFWLVVGAAGCAIAAVLMAGVH